MVVVNPVYADNDALEIQIEAAYEGKFKEGQWYPVKFTIHNPGPSVDGELVIRIAGQHSGKELGLVKSVELPANSTKEVWMTVPGMHLHQNNHVVEFRAGNVDGPSMKLAKSPVHIETEVLPRNSLLVGVLAEDQDTLQFLALLSQQSLMVQVVHLRQDQLPEEMLALESLDVLAINDFASDQLTDSQAKAIENWVRRGGVLVLSGGASYPKSAHRFSHLSPVEYLGTRSLTQIASFEKISGKELELTSSLTVSDSRLLDGRVLIEEDGIPLVVSKQQGHGAVLYVAYDLSLNPLASWNGHHLLWEKIISDFLPLYDHSNIRGDYWEMNRALDYFTQLKPPELSVLVWIFLAYALIVAPILYVLLKKWDKREWAWALIPLIAVVSSVIIFIVGANARTETLAQTLNIIELSDDGHAKKTTAAAVFVPKGGTYDVQLADGQYAASFGDQFYYGYRDYSVGSLEQMIYQEPEKHRLQFRDVPFWSIRKMWIHDGIVQETGKFTASIRYDTNMIKGEITNHTDQEFSKVFFAFGGDYAELGTMKAGESKSFEIGYHLSGIKARQMDMLPNFLFPHGGREDIHLQERAMFSVALTEIMQTSRQVQPLIIGINTDQQIDFAIDGKPVVAQQKNLYIQKVPFHFIDGNRIFIPYGMLQPFILENQLSSFYSHPDHAWVEMGQGTIAYEYRLPNVENGVYTRFTIMAEDLPASSTIEVWNAAEQQWITYTKDQAEFGEAFIENNLVRIQLTNHQDYVSAILPQISVEGVVNP